MKQQERKIKARGRGYNKHTIFTCLGIAVASFLVFQVVASIIDLILNGFNQIAYAWTLSWWEGVTFAIINTIESSKDLRATRAFPRATRADITAAEWYARIDAIALVVSSIMVISGFVSLSEFPRDYIAGGLTLAGMVYCFFQAWSTADRMRIKRLIKEDREDAIAARKAL